VFETAHGGTVFLDEIGDLPLMAQGMLLRVLQEGEIRRVGEARARQVDVRILAATHRDLSGMVAAGSFRQDLYYRLHVGSVALPALAERGSDVLTLAHHFLAQSAAGGSPPRLSNEAVTVLLAHRWPGNVRELKNVLAVACALAEDGVIGSEHLDIPHGTSPTNLYHQQLDALRRRLVASALAEAGGRRAEAARRLGVSRQLLSYLTRRFKL
jgi:DNA-binding NtrC family response regulator